MGWFDDVVDFVEDAADTVVEVVETVTEPVSNVVETVVNPIADAVSQIPIVGDVVEMAAPFGGMIGTVIGGPIGGAIGNAVGDAFGDGDGGFDILDTAIGMFGGDLPGPLADIAGGLLDGGSLIDTATSVFGGDLGGMAENLIGGQLGDMLGGDLGGIAQNLLGGEMPDLGDVFGGDLGGLAQNLLGGEMPDLGDVLDGDLGGLAQNLLGDNAPDLGGLGGFLGQVLGGEGGLPDLSEVGGLGGLIQTADSVFGGLGLGNLGSAATGIIGDNMPDLSGPGGWLDNLPDAIQTAVEGIGDGGGFELPFGMGSFPSIPDIAGPIGQGGGGWLDIIKDQADLVSDCISDPIFEKIEEFDLTDYLPHLPDVAIPSPTGPIPAPYPNGSDDGLDNDLDDLVFNLPGVDRDGAARDALQQLADTGNLGEALASLSQDDLTTLVTRLVAPTVSPTIDDVVDDAAASGQALDDLGLPDSVVGDTAQPSGDDAMGDDALGDDVVGDDVMGTGADDGLDGADTGITDSTMGDGATDAATSGLADDAPAAGQDDFDADPGLGLDADDGGFAQPAPAPPETFEPEPVENDFSEQIAQADAIEESFDSMFDDLGGADQG